MGLIIEDFGTVVKFGKQINILDLQNEGLLYLNNLTYFWDIEDEELRGDPFDSVEEVRRGPRVEIPLPDGKRFSMEGEWVIRSYPTNPEKINIFCMYALRPFSGTFPINEKIFRFGEFALVIIDKPEFFKRIESTLKLQKIRGEAGLVEYVVNDYTGQLGPFRKLKRFEYQSEWRLVCYDGPGGPRKIRIGSIKDISIIIRSNQINEEIKIEK